MVTDAQVRRLMKYIQKEKSYGIAAAKAGMDEKTARKYRDLGKLPSDIQSEHNWRSREDSFSEVWDEVRTIVSVKLSSAEYLRKILRKSFYRAGRIASYIFHVV